MKRFIKLFGLMGVVAVSLVACGTTEQEGETVIQMGVLRTADSLPLYIADEEELFEQYGVQVELVEFGSASDQSKAMESGAIDGMMTDMVVQCLLQKGGTAVRTVTTALGATATEGKFLVVANSESGINSVEDMEGKSIAISEGTMMEYLVDSYCNVLDISIDSLKKINIPNLSLRYETLIAGEADMAILPDPLGDLAVMNDGVAVIDDTAIDMNISRSVIAFREEFIRNHPQEMKNFMQGYNEAVDQINEKNEQDRNLILEVANVPEVMQDTWEIPHFTKNSVPDEDEVTRLMTWMVKKELLEETFAYDQVVDDSFCKEAE